MPAGSCVVPCSVPTYISRGKAAKPATSSLAIFLQNNDVIMRSSLCGFSTTRWRGLRDSGIRMTKLDFTLMGFRAQCFSSRRVHASLLPKENPQPSTKEESNAFYVVRKGDIIGIYKSFSDCEAQLSSSVCDPSVSVYKGFSLQKETEEYFASRGLNNALYSMNVVDMKEDLFGTLVPCPFQQPDFALLVDTFEPKKTTSHEGAMEMVDCLKTSSSVSVEQSKTHSEPGYSMVAHPIHDMTCILEYDGASKGNPGKSGGGAILRTEDGNVIYRVRQNLGVATNNVAEYRALIMGLKFALQKGFKQIRVQGDSRLVSMQVNGKWQTRNKNMADLCKEVKELKDNFLSFQITHVKREFNSDADAEANLAVLLPTEEVYEECGNV